MAAFRGLLDALRDPKNSQGLLDMGVSLMGASGPSQVPMSFGQRVAQGYVGSQQMAAERAATALRKRYMDAQIAAMEAPREQRQTSPIGQIDPRNYTPASVAKFQQSQNYGDLEPIDKGGGGLQTNDGPYGSKIVTGPDGRWQVVQPPAPRQEQQEPLVAVQLPDGKSVFVRRSQAEGQQPAAQREGAIPTEGERVAANYLGRMQESEKLLGDYVPQLKDFIAANRMMAGGAATSSIANMALSPEGQKYYQAAADWVRAKLRKESGAVIAPEEMAQEIKTYFPVPGDSKATIEQKKAARAQAIAGMAGMSGRAPAASPTGGAPDGPADYNYVPGKGLSRAGR